MQRFSLGVKILLLTAIPVVLVALIVGFSSFKSAMDELQAHEIVDLRDETSLRSARLASQIQTMREDALKLAYHPDVTRYVEAICKHSESEGRELAIDATKTDTNKLLGKVQQLFQNAGLQKFQAGVTGGERQYLKPYLQIRLIQVPPKFQDSKEMQEGREKQFAKELIRIERKDPEDPTEFPSFKPVSESDLQSKRVDRDYICEPQKMWEDDSVAGQSVEHLVFMSQLEANIDKRKNQQGVPVLRAAVPIGDSTGKFFGVIVINMDFERATIELTNSTRHWVWITKDDGGVAFEPTKLTMRACMWDDKENSGKPLRNIVELAKEHFEDNKLLETELVELFDEHRAEEVVPVARGEGHRRLEDRGSKLCNGESAELINGFALAKLNCEGVNIGELEDWLHKRREDGTEVGFRFPEKIRDTVLRLRADDLDDLRRIVFDMKKDFPELKKNVIHEPVVCRSFFLFYFRVYYDPADPAQHICIVQGFSKEELDADLSSKKWDVFNAGMVYTAFCAILSMLLANRYVTKRIKNLTGAVKEFTKGNFDAAVPASYDDEIGDLATGFVTMAEEVSKRDQEIRETNKELDNRVKERTRELQEASASREKFLANVSHELRTPLNHIGGFRQMLEGSDLDESQRDDLKKLGEAESDLLRLIDDILDFQKVNMGGLPITPEIFNVTGLVDDVAERMRSKIVDGGNDLEVIYEDQIPTAFNDPQRIRQILFNLIGNACKFTKNGKITIKTRLRDQSHVEIDVVDSGIGISQENQRKLFQPFAKIGDRKLNPGGTGLGLVISRKLGQLMGGDVTVASQPDVGSTFTARFLLEMENLEPSADLESAAVASNGPAKAVFSTESDCSSGPGSVLVIDDDPVVHEFITRFLEDEGVETVSALSGDEGLRLAKELRQNLRLITLDLMMPGIDGWAVLAGLKGDTATADIPVALVSMLDDKKRAFALGVSEYLLKPLDRGRLVELVSRYCGTGRNNVLVIDDDPKAREIVLRCLTQEGLNVRSAEDGQDGLRVLESEFPDVIVLDLLMPVMDGFEFVTEFKIRYPKIPIPIIVMTAHEPTEQERRQLSGAVSTIMKKQDGMNTDGLLSEIKNILVSGKVS